MPKITERLAISLGAAIFGLPLSFLVWFGINLMLLPSGDLELIWVGVGVAIFAVLGFLVPRNMGRIFSRAWQLLLNWF